MKAQLSVQINAEFALQHHCQQKHDAIDNKDVLYHFG
jgi:hypothetical protein